MKKIERFDKYMKFKGLNDNRVTNELGLSIGLLGKSRKEGRDLSQSAIEKILNFYTDLSRVWLMTGEGEMLRAPQPSATSNSGVKIGNVTASVNGCGAADGSAELSALKRENEALRRERDDAVRERDRLAGANSALTEVIRQLTGKN